VGLVAPAVSGVDDAAAAELDVPGGSPMAAMAGEAFGADPGPVGLGVSVGAEATLFGCDAGDPGIMLAGNTNPLGLELPDCPAANRLGALFAEGGRLVLEGGRVNPETFEDEADGGVLVEATVAEGWDLLPNW